MIEAPERGAIETVLEEDFANGSADWRLGTSAERPLEIDRSAVSASTGKDESGTYLTLSGTHGVAYRIVEVTPATCYEFSARVRARGIEAAEPFFGATTWIAELTRNGSPEDVLAEGPDKWVITRHLFETAAGKDGWQTRERLFVTGTYTKALLISANLSFDTAVTGGAVDFADIRVRRMPMRAAWQQSLEFALRDMNAGEAPRDDWRSKRLVRGHLGAEVRPSIVCFPGERTGFEVDVPAGAPVFETGIGVWSPAFVAGTTREQTFSVRVGGEPVWSLAHPARRSLGDGRWLDVSIDLSRWEGERVTVELAVDGDLPGVFGSPTVRNTESRPDVCNVLLISIDTLRADYVGSYGAPGNPTPNLDAFARESVRFAHVDGQAPYTLPGHASMLTGQFPSVHGVQRPTHALSSTRSPLLARILSDRGYLTQAFTGGGLVNADFGFDKGFDGFANIDPLRQRDAKFFSAIVNNNRVAMLRLRRNRRSPPPITHELINEHGPERLGRWLSEHANEPFFLFVHTYLVHDYDPPDEYLACRANGCTSTRTDYEEHRLTRRLGWAPQPVTDEERDHLRHLYDATLRFCDDLIGDLLAKLDELGLRDNTIVAIATDHGEEMFERGFMQHGKTLYEELTNLPMIIRVPGVEPRVIEEPSMLIDLTPTILGALGLPRDPRMQGDDRLDATSPVASDPLRPTWSEIHDDFVHKYALREAGWKLIHAPADDEVDFPADNEWELFDLTRDGGETNDLAASEPERLAAMQAQLQEQRDLLKAVAATLGDAGRSELDENTLAQLRELGYAD